MNKPSDIVVSYEGFENSSQIDLSYFDFNILMNMWTSWSGWYGDDEIDDKKKKEDEVPSWKCDHDWVNVSFSHIILVCKKCNKEKE